jgi:hypothetical protein
MLQIHTDEVRTSTCQVSGMHTRVGNGKTPSGYGGVAPVHICASEAGHGYDQGGYGYGVVVL